MANDAAPGGPPRPHLPPPPEVREGSEPSEPSGGGTYFLGRYRVVDEIGVGGMASVHLARADGPGGFQKWVAIKRIHRHLAEDDTFIRMFLDEARIAARISHPNVAQVFDLGKHRDTYWIAMEYLHGEPLREVMRAVEEAGAPAMGPQLAARIVADGAEGLHAAHELRDKSGKLLNLVHRDVTPHNLFLTYEGAVKVVDFGIAKVTNRLSNTRAGTLKGKLAYMSPEQVRGSAIDRRTDIFALGVVLWELTTSRRLFRMESDLETLERVQACVVPPPSSVVPDYPSELESIVMRALAKDPERRFQTAREVSRALQQYLMRAGSFVGPEELGGYVKHVLSDRFQRREAHLQWAAEVTQTVSIDQLEGGSTAEEISLLSYRSDVQEVPRGPEAPGKQESQHKPRPAAGAPAGFGPTPSGPQSAMKAPPTATPPPVSRPRPLTAPLPSHTGAEPPLPKFENTGSSGLLQDDDGMVPTRVTGMGQVPSTPSNPRSQTVMGLGPPVPPPAPLPAYGSSPTAASGPPEMHDYSSEDDEAVTTVIASPADALEEEEQATISTVHEPAKAYKPAPQPDDAVVVAPTLLMPGEGTAEVKRPVSAPVSSGYYGQPPVSTMQPASRQDNKSSVLIAVIAAATTLIALTLTALVVLKLTERPQPPTATAIPVTGATPVTAATTATAPPEPEPPEPKIVPIPQPTAEATTKTAEKTVKPDELPKETPKPTPKKPTTGGGTVVPVPQPVSTKKDPGFLTVVCDPFCDSVSAAGRSLGPSPVVRAALPPGTHGVVLRSKGSTKSISVTIVSGQTTARRVKM